MSEVIHDKTGELEHTAATGTRGAHSMKTGITQR